MIVTAYETLKQERDRYRKALGDILELSTQGQLLDGRYVSEYYDEGEVNEIIKEALK